MAKAELTIELSEDAFTVFMASRINICQSVECKFNGVNNGTGRANCILKIIYIKSGGGCGCYEPLEEKHNEH